ncbi:DUF4179 domain-containing protein [Lysinibacillus sp. KU-BSD001]|uniref:DUF4179 domain-containing protein n=1 Tax=Lysinibacillus sp. KU-BSD001 TaxID=3141328 RepID=UPI0036E9919C
MSAFKKLVDLNIDTIELAEVSDLEKQRVKQHVLGKKKKANWFKYVAVAATLTGVVTATTMFTAPSIASQIPFIKDVMHYFSEEETFNSHFGAVATDVTQIQSSNGVTVMIEDAVFDGTAITIAYAIETEKHLGNNPNAKVFFDVKGTTAQGGSDYMKKISDTTYIGTATIVPHFKEEMPQTLEVTWEPTAFTDYDTDQTVNGDWSFDFTIQALENNKVIVNETVTNDDISVTLTSYETNDYSTVFHVQQVASDAVLEKWQHVTTHFLRITDDLGNEYYPNNNGGASYDALKTYEWSSSIQTIDENASTLTLVPTVHYSAGNGPIAMKEELEPIHITLK